MIDYTQTCGELVVIETYGKPMAANPDADPNEVIRKRTNGKIKKDT